MGACSSKKAKFDKVDRGENEPLKQLLDRISSLENADKNGDGMLSMEEQQNWMKQCKAELDEYKENLVYAGNLEYELQINDLKKQIKCLENANDQLRISSPVSDQTKPQKGSKLSAKSKINCG